MKLLDGLTCSLAILLAIIFAPVCHSEQPETNGTFDSELSSLEFKIFQHECPNDTIEKRLNRLEKYVFGSSRSGSIDERITSLLLAIPNLSSRSEHQSVSQRPPLANEQPDYYPTVTALEDHINGKTSQYATRQVIWQVMDLQLTAQSLDLALL